MFCNQCGEKIEDDAKFCNKCGFKIAKEMGSITFSRENKYYGCLIEVKIYMDGNLVASVGNGKEVTVPASVGMHKIAFDVWSGNGINDIEITKDHPNIKVVFKLGMGALTSKPKITEIINL